MNIVSNLNLSIAASLIFFFSATISSANSNELNNDINITYLFKQAKLDRRSLNKLTCPDYFVLASRGLSEHGFEGIQAVEENGKIKVIIQQASRQNDGSRQFNNKFTYHDRTQLVDWKNLKGHRYQRYNGNECLMGKAVLSYLKALDKGSFDNAVWTKVDLGRVLKTIDYMYLVDSSGIDKTETKELFSSYEFKRVLVKTDLFSIGDHTRSGSWNSIANELTVSGTLKNSKNDDVFIDLYGGSNRHAFIFDQALSSKFGQQVWIATPSKTGTPVCLKWLGEHQKQICGLRAQKVRQGKFFLTKNKNTAIKLFESAFQKSVVATIKTAEKCPKGDFCNMSGGDYLNSLYNGDYYSFRKLDRVYLKPLLDKKNELTKAPDVKILFDLLGFNNDLEFSLLDFFTEQYLNGYKNNPEKCFTQGAQNISFSKKVPGMVSVNGFGVETWRTQGYTRYGQYKINKEFVKTCNRVCGVEGIGDLLVGGVDLSYNQGRISQVMMGLSNLMRDLDCLDPKIKRFEKNLIKFQTLQNEPLYFKRSSNK